MRRSAGENLIEGEHPEARGVGPAAMLAGAAVHEVHWSCRDGDSGLEEVV